MFSLSRRIGKRRGPGFIVGVYGGRLPHYDGLFAPRKFLNYDVQMSRE